MMGYSRDELDEGKLNWNRITAPEFHILASEALEQLNTLGACQPFEKEYIRKDGSRLYAYMGAALVEEGNHSQIITYIIDISPRKEAEKKEQQLRKIIDKQQEEFKSIFMNAPAMISIRRGPELRVEFQTCYPPKFMDGAKMIGKT
jgi:two-component system CheB/CheR fusion protein